MHNDIIRCKECKYFRVVNKVTSDYDCKRTVIFNIGPNDYCSRAERQLKCPQCGELLDEYPNFCSNCGYDFSIIKQHIIPDED